MRTEKIFSAVHSLLVSDLPFRSRIRDSLFSIKFGKENFTSLAHRKMDHLYGYTCVKDSLNMHKGISPTNKISINEIEKVAKSIYKRKMASSDNSKKLVLIEKSIASFQKNLEVTKKQIASKMLSCQKAKNPGLICQITLDVEELVCFAKLYQRRIKMADLEKKYILMPSADKKSLQDKSQAIEEFLRLIWKMYRQIQEPIKIKIRNEELEYPQLVRMSLLSFFSKQIQEVLAKSPDHRLNPSLKKIKDEIVDAVEFWRESITLMSPASNQGISENPLYFI